MPVLNKIIRARRADFWKELRKRGSIVKLLTKDGDWSESEMKSTMADEEQRRLRLS